MSGHDEEHGQEVGTWEGLLGLGAEAVHGALEVGGHLGHGLAALPIAGSVIHAGLGAYHAYEMYSLNEQANSTEDINEAQRLRLEAIKQGHEVEQNALEAIPLVGTGFGIASLMYNTGMLENDGQSAAEKVWGDPTTTSPPKVDAHGDPILDCPMPIEPEPEVCE